VQYSLGVIELELAKQLLTGTTLIGRPRSNAGSGGGEVEEQLDIELAGFRFAGEVLPRNRDLLSALTQYVKQEELPQGAEAREEPFLNETKHAVATLKFLEQVIFNCTKTALGGSCSLRKYCQTMRLGETSEARRILHVRAIHEVPLRQLRSLYECIEDKVADEVIRTIPERFQRMPSAQSGGAKAVVNQMCQSLGGGSLAMESNAPPAEDAAPGLGRERSVSDGSNSRAIIRGVHLLEPALKRFICRFLSTESCEYDPSWPLRDFADDFSWPGDVSVNDEDLDEAFPKTVLLSQAYHIWTQLQRQKEALTANVASAAPTAAHRRPQARRGHRARHKLDAEG